MSLTLKRWLVCAGLLTAFGLGCNAPTPQPINAAPTPPPQHQPLQGQAHVTWTTDAGNIQGIIWVDGERLHVAVKDPMSKVVVARLVVASSMISATDMVRSVQFIALDSGQVLRDLGLPQKTLATALFGQALTDNTSPLTIERTLPASRPGFPGVHPIKVRHHQTTLLTQQIDRWRTAPPPANAFSHQAPAGFDVRKMEELGTVTLQTLLAKLTAPDLPHRQSPAEASGGHSTRSPSTEPARPPTAP